MTRIDIGDRVLRTNHALPEVLKIIQDAQTDGIGIWILLVTGAMAFVPHNHLVESPIWIDTE